MRNNAFSIAGSVAEFVPCPLVVIDTNMYVQEANLSFYQTFHIGTDEAENHLLFDLSNGAWNIPTLRTSLQGAGSAESRLDDFEIEQDFPTIGRRRLLISPARFQPQDSQM